MYLARIDGTITSTVKHETLAGCRLLIGRRLESDGQASGDPLVFLDWLGAARGSTVLVSTDGDIARSRLGNTTPGRLVVAGLVDHVCVGKRIRRDAL
jgi:ethanolamine utilization protein EutN